MFLTGSLMVLGFHKHLAQVGSSGFKKEKSCCFFSFLRGVRLYENEQQTEGCVALSLNTTCTSTPTPLFFSFISALKGRDKVISF